MGLTPAEPAVLWIEGQRDEGREVSESKGSRGSGSVRATKGVSVVFKSYV